MVRVGDLQHVMTSPVNHDPMKALMVAPMRNTPSLMIDGAPTVDDNNSFGVKQDGTREYG
ncbi:hypothetical protein F2Q69_00006149 [Brassica cretica]|uniref:Uncharacterized protein n=1 Tax=Brassica cretica TaxID=69181 RepID=A0A8S9PQ89_BRACR|nr:hypothetical protein F2Q69_00006149 [Brassica cretica]